MFTVSPSSPARPPIVLAQALSGKFAIVSRELFLAVRLSGGQARQRELTDATRNSSGVLGGNKTLVGSNSCSA